MSKLIWFRRFGAKDVIEAEDLDVSQPDAGEVLAAVHAACVEEGHSVSKTLLKVA